jgi:hypothetical protein
MLIFIFLVLIFYILYKVIFQPFNSENNIEKFQNIFPKKIWTYWDDYNSIPKTVKMCIEGWKKYNPDYEITLITKETVNQYIDIPDNIRNHPNFNDSPARFSDLVRLYILYEYGGIWIDSSIILQKSLSEWLVPLSYRDKNVEFSGFFIQGFTTDKKYPVIESWFFACIKNSPFVKLWKDEFIELSKYANVNEYLESRKKMGVDIQGISCPNYLAIHVSAQKVMQIDNYPLDNFILNKAEDGPFKYLVDSGWDSKNALFLACGNSNYTSPILKLRGSERNILEQLLNDELSNEKCRWM